MSRYRKCVDPRHGHRWGGWCRTPDPDRATRRCRRRRCPAVQVTKPLSALGLRRRGEQLVKLEAAA